MRRAPGIGGLRHNVTLKTKAEKLGTEVETDSISKMQEQIEKFQQNLSDFSIKHKDKISKNPLFRYKFQKMCFSIGVDPLASNKGIWAQNLGVGNFYYELSVQIIEACFRTRGQNGGMISVTDLLTVLRNKRHKKLTIRARNLAPSTVSANPTQTSHGTQNYSENNVSIEDIKTALSKISILGNSYRVIVVGGREMVLSIPIEFETDHIKVLELARTHAHRGLSSNDLQLGLKWTKTRCERAVEALVREGLCWVDEKCPLSDSKQNHDDYQMFWFPSIWIDHRSVDTLTDD